MMVKMKIYCADNTAENRFGFNKFLSLSLYF